MPKILIVEDNENLQQAYEITFVREGYTVLTASDGQQALDKVPVELPDIVILDMMMPMMSGLDFLEQLNKKEKYPNMKIIVFSNMSDPDAIKAAMDLGADRFMIKAVFSPKAMVAMVKEALPPQDPLAQAQDTP